MIIWADNGGRSLHGAIQIWGVDSLKQSLLSRFLIFSPFSILTWKWTSLRASPAAVACLWPTLVRGRLNLPPESMMHFKLPSVSPLVIICFKPNSTFQLPSYSLYCEDNVEFHHGHAFLVEVSQEESLQYASCPVPSLRETILSCIVHPPASDPRGFNVHVRCCDVRCVRVRKLYVASVQHLPILQGPIFNSSP